MWKKGTLGLLLRSADRRLSQDYQGRGRLKLGHTNVSLDLVSAVPHCYMIVKSSIPCSKFNSSYANSFTDQALTPERRALALGSSARLASVLM